MYPPVTTMNASAPIADPGRAVGAGPACAAGTFDPASPLSGARRAPARRAVRRQEGAAASQRRRGPILPPATLGVLGGGPFGMYFTRAASALGYRVAVLDPDPHSPAMREAHHRIVAAHADPDALASLRDACAAVTIDIESIPAASVLRLEAGCVASPRAESVAMLQDRLREKRFLRAVGMPTVPFKPVISEADLDGPGCLPGILKSARQDNDGRGQIGVPNLRAARAAFQSLGSRPCVLERRVDPQAELSVVLARGTDGEVRSYPVAENVHQDGILRHSVVPARVEAVLAQKAQAMACEIARCLDYVGVLAVEFFLCDGRLVVNEISPRPHSSAHYTLEACATSQFEQQVRALCGLPLGEPAPRSAAAMVTVLGDAWSRGEPDWGRVLGDSGGILHLYGKAHARPGRKMGHITILCAARDEAVNAASACLTRLHRSAPATGAPPSPGGTRALRR